MTLSAMSLASAVSSYLNDCALAKSAGTIRVYRYNLSGLLRFCSSKRIKHLHQVKPDDLRAFLLSLREAGLSASIVHQNFRAAKTFLNFCMRQGWLSSNPILSITPPPLPRPVPVYLSATDLHRFLEMTKTTRNPKRDFALCMVFLDTGLRLSELAALNTGDVDLDGRRVIVRLGKGSRGRVVPVCNDTVRAIKKWLVVRPSKLSGLFGLTKWGIYLLVKRLAKRLGFRVFPHALRHTFASLYGGDIEDLRRILGHSNIKTTASIYTHRAIGPLVAAHNSRSPVSNLQEMNSQRFTATGYSNPDQFSTVEVSNGQQ